MVKLPIEIQSRARAFIDLSFGGDGFLINESDILSRIVLLNKIVYSAEIADITRCLTYKVNTVDNFAEYLDTRYMDDRMVFCFRNAFMSPTIHSLTDNSSKKMLMVDGFFVKVDDDFELKEIIDRERQINLILSNE